jgi:hypothetical protein
MQKLTKLFTTKETRGIDILRKLGKVTQTRENEYTAFVFNGIKHKINQVAIKRDKKGYNVYCSLEKNAKFPTYPICSTDE